MKRIFLLLLITLFLAACGGSSIEDGIVGKWTAAGTEAFNTFEFFDDGTGFLSTADGSFTVDFTYKFASADTITMTIDGDESPPIKVSMPDENRLTFEPEDEEVINLRRADE